MRAHAPAIPEMIPKAMTLAVQSLPFATLSTWAGSRSWMGVSCAIQIPSHAVAKRAIHPPPTRRFGSANGERDAGTVGVVIVAPWAAARAGFVALTRRWVKNGGSRTV